MNTTRASRCSVWRPDDRGALTIGLVLMVGTWATGVASASPPYYVNPSNEFLVAGGPGKQRRPDVEGTIVVWLDLGSPYAKDLGVSAPTPKLLGPGGYGLQVSGDFAVWYWSDHMWASDVTAAVPQPVQLTSAPSRGNKWPSISGNMVVWLDQRDHPDRMSSDIYGYDLSDPDRGDFLIVSGGNRRLWPSISGDWLVWREEGPERIWAMDLGSPTPSAILLDDAFAGGNPIVDGTTVLWNRSDWNNWDVYAFDLDDLSGSIFPIATSGLNESVCAVSGNIAVIREIQTNSRTLYGVDLRDVPGSRFEITEGDISKFVGLHGNTVVWAAIRDDDYDIYGNTIIPDPATLSLLALGGLMVLRPRRR